MAEVPAPTVIGVKRVVVACEFDSSLSAAESRTLCEQLVRKAQTATSFPVSLVGNRGDRPLDLTQMAEQLLLRIKVSGTRIADNRKALHLAISPVRLGVSQGQVGELNSTASLVKVADDWIVQGHIDAFHTLLGGAPKKLHRPIGSDE